ELSFNEAFVFHFLYRREQEVGDASYYHAAQLCDKTKILKSQMNRTLNGLEERGLIERIRAGADRRKVYIRLSPEGRAVYEREHQRILEFVRAVIAKLDPEDVKALTAYLNTVAGNVQALLFQ
ncbi:MAG: winged helix DNA-binding protein, partial [Clostridiales bacterium]|nr:winged helix DNA-binding protein [Clostridiales bacterium]